MTSRERVRRTLNHQPVDRMPIDLGGHESTGISAFAYRNLRENLGLPVDPIRVHDTVQMLAYVQTDILERFHCDCIALEPMWARSRRWKPRDPYVFTIPEEMEPVGTPDGGWTVEYRGRSMRMPAGGFFFDGDWINSWNDWDEERVFGLYRREAERLHHETEYAMNYVGYSYGGGFNGSLGAGDLDRAVAAFDDPDGVLAANRSACKESIRRFRLFNRIVGPFVTLLTIGEDMGSQSGPLCSPGYIEKFCMPFTREFCRVVHEESDIKVYMHNCGAIRSLIPLIIDAGVDALNPVQISARDMDPRALKKEFGERIVFWGGGCNTQEVLGVGTPAEVAANVRELAGIFKPCGGFVFSQVHNIMGNVPPENVVAMLDTAYEVSGY